MAPEKRLCLCRPLSWPALSISFFLLAVPAWTQTYKVLYAFDDQSKLRAGSTLVQDKMGNIYGASWDSARMCPSGPCGAIYKISPTGQEGALYEFKGRPDGSYPVGIAIDAHGTLYGTTMEGGTSTLQSCNSGCGTVFSLTASGQETVLHSFQGFPPLRTFHGPTNDGILPGSGVVVYPGGVLYGTTTFGGSYASYGLPGDGTIYQITPGNNFVTILHNFTEGLDGGLPSAGLLLVGATLYGTAQFGGFGPCVTTFGPGCGTVFKYDANGLTTLYQFQGADSADGASPGGILITDNAGNLYGTTVLGGDLNCNWGFGIPPGCGVVFKVSPSGQEITLYTFTGSTDGTWPSSALVMDAAGNLYGTAYFGGDLKCNYGMGCGTIFKIDLSGNFSVVHTFNGADGAFPMAIIARDGKLLGVTNAGGPANRGVVYELTP